MAVEKWRQRYDRRADGNVPPRTELAQTEVVQSVIEGLRLWGEGVLEQAKKPESAAGEAWLERVKVEDPETGWLLTLLMGDYQFPLRFRCRALPRGMEVVDVGVEKGGLSLMTMPSVEERKRGARGELLSEKARQSVLTRLTQLLEKRGRVWIEVQRQAHTGGGWQRIGEGVKLTGTSLVEFVRREKVVVKEEPAEERAVDCRPYESGLRLALKDNRISIKPRRGQWEVSYQNWSVGVSVPEVYSIDPRWSWVKTNEGSLWFFQTEKGEMVPAKVVCPLGGRWVMEADAGASPMLGVGLFSGPDLLVVRQDEDELVISSGGGMLFRGKFEVETLAERLGVSRVEQAFGPKRSVQLKEGVASEEVEGTIGSSTVTVSWQRGAGRLSFRVEGDDYQDFEFRRLSLELNLGPGDLQLAVVVERALYDWKALKEMVRVEGTP